MKRYQDELKCELCADIGNAVEKTGFSRGTLCKWLGISHSVLEAILRFEVEGLDLQELMRIADRAASASGPSPRSGRSFRLLSRPLAELKRSGLLRRLYA